MSAFDRFQRILITLLIGVAFFYGGYYYGKRGFVFEVRKNPPKIEVINQYPGDSSIDFSLMWDVWDIVQANYLDRPVDPQKMLYGAISGMVSSLGDPYTSFLPPQINESITNALNGTYEGIGAELGMEDNVLIIIAPLDGSPAKAAGLRAGDKILKIEDESTIGISISEAVSKIRGPAGTNIILTIQSGEEKAKDITITRGNITIASVTWEDKGEGTAYIRVSRFGGETNREWTKAVSEINIQMVQLDALIIDVRGNPGGYLESSIYLAEEFFINKPVLYTEEATGDLTPMEAKRMGSFVKIPAVFVLIDGGSASASEILAAALRYHIGAVLIGETSFGKGTIQDAEDFSDGSGIHITVAKWLTPEKEWVHKTGIEPDIIVERTVEDVEQGLDMQLEKAIELAKEI